jgi:hypothetical protein
MARALEIPTVVAWKKSPRPSKYGDLIIIDGFTGTSSAIAMVYQRIRKSPPPARTTEGTCGASATCPRPPPTRWRFGWPPT